MTNQSHTELVARLRLLADWIDESVWSEPELNDAPKTIHEAAAALESPERVQGGLAMLPREPNDEMCDQGAQALVSWENGSVWPESWGEIAARQYRKDARKAWVAMAETFLCATPSPQAEKQPLSLDEIRAWAVRRTSALGPEGITDPIAFLEDGVRWGEAQHGIVTKESSK